MWRDVARQGKLVSRRGALGALAAGVGGGLLIGGAPRAWARGGAVARAVGVAESGAEAAAGATTVDHLVVIFAAGGLRGVDLWDAYPEDTSEIPEIDLGAFWGPRGRRVAILYEATDPDGVGETQDAVVVGLFWSTQPVALNPAALDAEATLLYDCLPAPQGEGASGGASMTHSLSWRPPVWVSPGSLYLYACISDGDTTACDEVSL